jgi:hypothetical protein
MSAGLHAANLEIREVLVDRNATKYELKKHTNPPLPPHTANGLSSTIHAIWQHLADLELGMALEQDKPDLCDVLTLTVHHCGRGVPHS